MNHWLSPKPLACLDMKEGDCQVNFIGDISKEETWTPIKIYTFENDKFDFAICTHVLEDVRNPQLVLDMMPMIAKEGFVSMPSKTTELMVRECHEPETQERMGIRRSYRGYIHHRWIFTIKEDILWIFPKLPILEVMDGLDYDGEHPGELGFFWKEAIPYKTFQDDWLGPNPWDLAVNYRNALKEGI